jgi:hypothetical protein
MNWTSTRIPLWQSDCEQFRKLRRPFEVRDVGPENDVFVDAFANRFDFDVDRRGSTATLSPKG